MTISKKLLDELLSGVEKPEDFFGDKGLMKELKVRLMERMLGAELTEHLGYEPHRAPASQQSNRRNGATRKMLKGNDGAVPIDIPRDRDGSFEPELVKKGQTRIDGMDDKIIRCPSGDCMAICREGAFMPRDYPPEIFAPTLRKFMDYRFPPTRCLADDVSIIEKVISRVTDAVLEEVSDWQNRALEPVYPIVFLDALRVKIRDAASR